MVGAPGDNNETGAVFAFAPPDPVCNSVSATGPQGGGSVAVSLSCTLPFGAHSNYSILGGPSNGSVSGFNASSGQLVYTSAAFFSGQDSFTYRVSDQWGISNIATATLHIPFLPVPTCSNVTAKGKKGATKVTVTLKCKGPAGHPFTYGIVSKPSSGKLGKVNQSNGKLTYTTHVGFSGNDRFVYNATNSGGSSKAATATIVLPKLGRINSTMTWDFAPLGDIDRRAGHARQEPAGRCQGAALVQQGLSHQDADGIAGQAQGVQGQGEEAQVQARGPEEREPRPHAVRRTTSA